MAKDYYQTLGISKGASPEEVKKAYYKMAHQHHPHKGGDEAKMKEINEAYSVLGNAEKKAQYDQYGQTFEQARSQGGFSGAGGFRDFSDFASAFGQQGGQGGNNFSFEFGDLGDIFGDLFGMGSSRSKSRRASKFQGADIEAELTLDFQEAVFGTEKELSLNKNSVCQKCKGEGAEPGAKVMTCSTCRGTGQVVRNMGFGIGFPSVCPTCEGTGKKAEKECSQCRGQGVTKETEHIKVKIPAGIDNGQTVRLAGKGQAGNKGGQAGDLYLRIKVLPDLRFKRAGFDLKTKKEISFTQAALGAKIDIETLDGTVRLKIPEATQSGKIFQLKGRGVPILHGRGRGDQLVEIIVKTPSRLSRRQKELLKELEQND
ncbi:MAG: molecular chaperone DnaJ [Patescibacteria group bacterium]|jgi:molecular chaperone DnaJ